MMIAQINIMLKMGVQATVNSDAFGCDGVKVSDPRPTAFPRQSVVGTSPTNLGTAYCTNCDVSTLNIGWRVL